MHALVVRKLPNSREMLKAAEDYVKAQEKRGNDAALKPRSAHINGASWLLEYILQHNISGEPRFARREGDK